MKLLTGWLHNTRPCRHNKPIQFSRRLGTALLEATVGGVANAMQSLLED